MKSILGENTDAWAEAAEWFLGNTDDIFMIVRGGRALHISAGWTKLLGWSRQEAMERSFWDFVHPDDLETVRQAVAGLVATGRGVYEHRVRARSGDYVRMRVRAKLAADGTGIAVMQDIGDELRRAAEAAEIAQANALLSQAAGVKLWRYDPIARRYEFDPDFSHPVADTPPGHQHSVAGVSAATEPADRPALTRAVARTVDTGEFALIDYRAKGSNGAPRRLRSAMIGGRQLPCGRREVIGLTQDLTELMSERDRALAGEVAAKAAQRAKSDFLANIGHELLTPMNGIMAALHLAKSASGKARGDLLDQAMASGGELTDLLGDLVEFADGQTASVDVALAPVAPRGLIESVLEAHRCAAGAKGLWLRSDTSVDELLLLDSAKLRKILKVLVGNGVKFTQTGGVEVRAALTGAGSGQQLRIEVSDTGPGIGMTDQAHLFDSFEQADASPTRRFGGAGLGLARARQLAQAMGGAIGCRSAPGQGATFRLDLPAQSAPDVSRDGPHLGEAMRVLVVDDNITNLRLVGAMLSALEATVTTAADGAEAVAAVAEGQFDLVLMDIQMPVMDGVEATRRIRALPEPAGRVPIVALTANVLADQRARYAEVGMDGCIAKPLSPAALMAELGRLASPASLVA